MARTDKSQPYRVRLWDGTLRKVAWHDHRNGVCDLPANLADDLAMAAADGARGHVDPFACRWELHFDGSDPCGCRHCHGSDRLRAERRASRSKARRQLGDVRKRLRAKTV